MNIRLGARETPGSNIVRKARRPTIPLAALIAAGLIGTATADTGPPATDLAAIPMVILHPRDAQGRAAINYYPETAYRAGINGLAVIDCKVSPAGDLDGCSAVAEYPSHCFFGAATVKMAERRVVSAPPDVVQAHAQTGDTVRLKMPFVIANHSPNVAACR